MNELRKHKYYALDHPRREDFLFKGSVGWENSCALVQDESMSLLTPSPAGIGLYPLCLHFEGTC